MNKKIQAPLNTLQSGLFSALPAQQPSPMPRLPSLEDKGQEVFFKSQVSLAETCQDDNPRLRIGCEDHTDEDRLSTDSKNMDDSSMEMEICPDFFLKGYCMRGRRCRHDHDNMPTIKDSKSSRRIRLWIFEEMPDVAVLRKRTDSFLN